MKKALFIWTILFSATLLHAQTPEWLWAESSEDNYYVETGRTVCTDADGNVFVAGDFLGQNMIVENDTLINTISTGDKSDVFIIKYSPSGNVIWAKTANGNSWDEIYGVCTDPDGNVLITGRFASDSISFDDFTLLNSGVTDIFIVKLDSNGNVLWAKNPTGIFYERGYDICTDLMGNIYITGGFYSPEIVFGDDTLTRIGTNGDFFIAKYDSSGTALWAKNAIDALSNSICIDSQGNVLVSGWYTNTSIVFENDTLISMGSSDIFIVKYDENGNVLWTKTAGGLNEEKCNGISCDTYDNIYITGYFRSQIAIFGNDTLTNSAYTGYADDIFIAKYDASGNMIWVKSQGGIGGDQGFGIDVGPDGNLWATGFIADTYIYIAKYDSSGFNLFTDSIGNSGSGGMGFCITTDTYQNVLVTGQYIGPTLAFGSNILTNADASGTYPDFFVAKLHDNITSLNENQNTGIVQIFPNPCHSQAVLQSDIQLNQAVITVVDIYGQTVKHIKNISERTVTLNFDNLKSGLYFVFLTMDNKIIATEKLMIID